MLQLLVTLGLLLVAISPLIAPRTVRGWGFVLLCGSFFSSSWNAVHMFGQQPSDVLLILSTMFLLASRRVESARLARLPMLFLVGAGLFIVSGMFTAVWPPGENYTVQRFKGHDPYATFGGHETGGGNIEQLLKLLVALVLVPLAVSLLEPTVKEIRALAGAWVASVVASCAVAGADESGRTHVSAYLLNYTDITGRQAGLTVQPNHLGVAAAICMPLALSWVVDGKTRVRGVLSLIVLVTGLLLSQSRGGLAVAMFMTIMTSAVIKKLRGVLLTGIVLTAGIIAVMSRFAIAVVEENLTNRVGAERSNMERLNLFKQGWADFLESPVHGIGFDYLTAAHEVHIQLLAATGLIGFAAYVCVVIAVLKELPGAYAIERNLSAGLAFSIGTWVLVGFLENQLADRYLYVPIALIIAVAALKRRESSPAEERHELTEQVRSRVKPGCIEKCP